MPLVAEWRFSVVSAEVGDSAPLSCVANIVKLAPLELFFGGTSCICTGEGDDSACTVGAMFRDVTGPQVPLGYIVSTFWPHSSSQ